MLLFTDDWLASQNHQIHLATVTFITVIFKVTATCLVSQHWPPHIYSHPGSPPPHPASSVFLSPSVTRCLVTNSPVACYPRSFFFELLLSDFFFSTTHTYCATRVRVSLPAPEPAAAVGLCLVRVVWRGWARGGKNKNKRDSCIVWSLLQGVCMLRTQSLLQKGTFVLIFLIVNHERIIVRIFGAYS